MPAIIDGNKPTQSEVVAHNMKVAKANVACDMVRAIAANGEALKLFRGSNGLPDASQVASFAIGVAEGVIEAFSMMPDANGMRGGLVS